MVVSAPAPIVDGDPLPVMGDHVSRLNTDRRDGISLRSCPLVTDGHGEGARIEDDSVLVRGARGPQTKASNVLDQTRRP